jgi:dephospho-CoA kinase
MAARSGRATARVLGLTGPIGCGKTTVGDILLELGARERIDADEVVHELQRPGTDVTAAVAGSFGQDVLHSDGSIDRASLGAIVFADHDALARLEAIIHPAVREAIRQRIEATKGGVIVVDAVKLLQSDLLPLVEEVWVVGCDPRVERSRLTEIRGMSPEQVEARLRAQPSFEHPRVARVIQNSGSLEGLRRQVEAAWRNFC